MSDDPFGFKVNTREGATFTPWTNGWAIGFKVTAPDQGDRYVVLNPSGAVDSGNIEDTDAFVYVVDPASYTDPEAGVPGAVEDTLSGMLDTPECFVLIWPKDEEPVPATVANMRRAVEAGLNAVAYSPTTGEENSATPGDYFMLADDDPLTDHNGDVMFLAIKTAAEVAPIFPRDLSG